MLHTHSVYVFLLCSLNPDCFTVMERDRIRSVNPKLQCSKQFFLITQRINGQGNITVKKDRERNDKMDFKNITVAGGGVLGSQISLMCAYTGHQVTILERDEDALKGTMIKLKRYRGLILSDLEAAKELIGNPAGVKLYPKGLIRDWQSATPELIDKLLEQGQRFMTENIRLETDAAEAVKDADAVIEAITEDAVQKTAFYQSISSLLPEKTIVCSNSSTLLPSTFAQATGRPEKFCAMHFANSIWKRNTAEVMGHPGTSPETFQNVVKLAREINMIPMEIHKEKAGYLLNTMLIPFQWAGLCLWATGTADPETIDKTWEYATGAPSGPLEISDRVGLDTIYHINLMMPEVNIEGSDINILGKVLEEKIAKGETGVNAGKGIYDYTQK